MSERRADPMRLWVGTWMPNPAERPKVEQRQPEEEAKGSKEEHVAASRE